MIIKKLIAGIIAITGEDISVIDIICSIKKNGFKNEFNFWLNFKEYYENSGLTYEGFVELAFRYSKDWIIYN